MQYEILMLCSKGDFFKFVFVFEGNKPQISVDYNNFTFFSDFWTFVCCAGHSRTQKYDTFPCMTLKKYQDNGAVCAVIAMGFS